MIRRRPASKPGELTSRRSPREPGTALCEGRGAPDQGAGTMPNLAPRWGGVVCVSWSASVSDVQQVGADIVGAGFQPARQRRRSRLGVSERVRVLGIVDSRLLPLIPAATPGSALHHRPSGLPRRQSVPAAQRRTIGVVARGLIERAATTPMARRRPASKPGKLISSRSPWSAR